MNNKFGQSQQSHKPPAVNPFANSLIEMGGSKRSDNKSQTLGEHIDASLDFVADSLFGFGGDNNSSNSKQSDNTSDNGGNNLFADALKKEQEKNGEMSEEMKKQKHLAQHKEMQMTEVFDLEKKKSEQMITQIKEELGQLVNEIAKMSGNVDQSVHTAVFQGKGEAGKYYENFFTQLRNFLVLLTKRVKEGNTWMQAFHGKKNKSLFMQNSAKYGSQYQFGQEGQGLTRQSG
ncbi:MAG: DUF5660 family protein [Patescibacteria group bacterium]